MKNRRDLLLLVGLFAALIGFVIISPRLQPPPTDPGVPTTRSTDAAGAQALYTWLRQINYDAQRLEYREFALGEADAALFILNPSETISDDQAEEILFWVDNGGTLILADDTSVTFGARNALLDELDVSFDVYTSTQTFTAAIIEAQPKQPVFDQPATGSMQVNTSRIVLNNSDDYVDLVGTDDATVITGRSYGSGYIYLSTATYPFTNEGLRDQDNAALILNMLRRVPPGGRIQFDEYHLGYFTPPSPPSLVFSSPLGWAAAYAVIATALFLILSGRRFGRPIPLKEEVTRRNSAEYVTSMADLFQRGGKRAYILRHYHEALKRRLAKRDGINPRLEDTEFVRELARARSIDEAALLDLLKRLRNERASEEAVVRAVADAEAMLKQTTERMS